MAAAKKKQAVPRPLKKSEYEIRFVSTHAQKGWNDLVATKRNSMVDAWDFLNRTPTARTHTNYPLKGELGTVHREGESHQQWQHTPTQGGDARIWFYVQGQTVFLVKVHTHHPNETK